MFDHNVPEILHLFEEIREAGDCVSLKQLAVNGGDLLAMGLEHGKEIGDGLLYLLNIVIEHPDGSRFPDIPLKAAAPDPSPGSRTRVPAAVYSPEIHTFSLPLLSSRSRFDPPISRSDLFQLSAQDMRKPW